ncbi:YpbF family protein [Heyndrickxia acidiproducens]|uniref:YpbF family protein n=1 Tax=Heyndrickxia acidiproducens TaxID=1121084 RepID=UPI00035ED77E|nr:YpbF family protein [Heyndrickxia acidiproducens]
MEPSIVRLGEGTDEATKQMLQNVVKRKREFERYRKRHLLIMWTSIFYTFGWAYYLYAAFIEPFSYSLFKIFSIIAAHQVQLGLLLVTAALWGMSKIWFDKREKAEKEYHALRCEIVDRSKDLWKGESWQSRHKVFEMMQKEFDINLYHENK